MAQSDLAVHTRSNHPRQPLDQVMMQRRHYAAPTHNKSKPKKQAPSFTSRQTQLPPSSHSPQTDSSSTASPLPRVGSIRPITLPKALPYKTPAKPSTTPHAASPEVRTANLERTRAKDLAAALRRPNRARPAILAVGIAAIVALGSWYGVGLKMWREKSAAEKAARMEVEMGRADVQEAISGGGAVAQKVDDGRRREESERREMIRSLEGARARAVYARDDFGRKIRGVEERAERRRREQLVGGVEEEKRAGKWKA